MTNITKIMPPPLYDNSITPKKKAFLGGTVVGINPLYGWRGILIPMLNIDYFNPVMKEYGKAEIEEEYKQKEICDYNVFVITPDIRGYFSLVEAVDISNKKPKSVVFCVLDETFENKKKFTKAQLQSLDRVSDLIKRNGGNVFYNLIDVAAFLNS
jgi:hypothetical protein